MSQLTVTLSHVVFMLQRCLPACEDKRQCGLLCGHCDEYLSRREQLSGNTVRLITMCKDDAEPLEHGAKRQKGKY